MMIDKMTPGTFRIRNVSGQPYSVHEIAGHLLDNEETVDLLDVALPVHYDDWATVKSLCTVANASDLYQAIQSGEIEIVDDTPPRRIR